MNRKYITPDIEITFFSTEDIITSSDVSGGTNDSNISTASLEQAGTPQVNDFTQYFN